MENFSGKVGTAEIYEDGNIVADASDDAAGGIFSKFGIVLVNGAGLRKRVRDEPHIGGGATSLWIYVDYAYGERSAGNWVYRILSDATNPTS